MKKVYWLTGGNHELLTQIAQEVKKIPKYVDYIHIDLNDILKGFGVDPKEVLDHNQLTDYVTSDYALTMAFVLLQNENPSIISVRVMDNTSREHIKHILGNDVIFVYVNDGKSYEGYEEPVGDFLVINAQDRTPDECIKRIFI